MNRSGKLAEFKAALRASDPFVLAQVLELPSIGTQQHATPPPSQKESVQSDGIDWSFVATAWLDAWQLANAGFAVKCYERQAALHTSFNQVFASSPGNILVPALRKICQMTHRVAVAADREAGSSDNAKLQNAVILLQESFSRTFNDRKELRPEDNDDSSSYYDSEGSKKAGVLFIVNELFAIYFRLNTLRLCRNLARPVEARKLHEQGTTLGQKVTYRYYTGRLSLFEDQYKEAEANLDYALKHCHRNATRNKQCILRYLVPVKLYRGRLPSAALLQKYELFEFVPIVEGIRKGDLRTFNDALVKFQHRFIKEGTYLLLEKCKTVCYRNLFKRIQYILDKPQISLSHVATTFSWLGMAIDLDEIECILANLIYRRYVRGYLAHTKRVLMLSKRDPFPVSAVIADKTS